MTLDEQEVRLAHILTHPVRHTISKLLSENPKMYIAQISDEADVDRKVVTFHLKIMEQEGLINTKLDTKVPRLGNPVLVRYAWLTEKAQEILKKCHL